MLDRRGLFVRGVFFPLLFFFLPNGFPFILIPYRTGTVSVVGARAGVSRERKGICNISFLSRIGRAWEGCSMRLAIDRT
ncbi:hypothetical protein HOY82DRAFT_400536 [Tuber indicum]|nr:hypothetical protein HOY82DRAFT_400536 [Tuber indicum]